MTTVALGAYDAIRQEVLRRVEADALDTGDLEAVRAAVAETVEAYQRRAHLGDQAALRDPADMVQRVLRSITAFGPLTDLLARPDVEEVFIEGHQVTYIDASGRLQGLRAPTTEAENRAVVERLLASTNRALDTANPLVQARVLQGTARLTAAIEPVAESLSATLRRHTLRRDTLSSLVERGSLTPPAAAFLWAVMQATSSILVSGPPGAGKTSLLSACLAAIPTNRCIRCCEEIRELAVPLTHGSYYEARPSGPDGSAEVSLRDLVKFCLAMRPDHLVVGEVRGAEAWELSRAVNAGCPVFTMDGGSATVKRWLQQGRRSTPGSATTGLARASAWRGSARSARPSVSGRGGRSPRSSSTTTCRRSRGGPGPAGSNCSPRSRSDASMRW
jgi:pilus assembly protein CpaF